MGGGLELKGVENKTRLEETSFAAGGETIKENTQRNNKKGGCLTFPLCGICIVFLMITGTLHNEIEVPQKFSF